MTTLVGTQTNFADALRELIELDYDAVEAYEAAINRIEDKGYQIQLTKFKEDHQRHIKEGNELLAKHAEDTVDSPSAKQWLAKGKVVLANLAGDEAILKAMITNEDDTNTAYENMNEREDKWEDAYSFLELGLEDERRHKKWMEDNVS
jgi:rubrerythrin